MDHILKLIPHLNLQAIDKILLKINEREDIYCEWITNEDYDKKTLQACKDSEYGILNIELIEDFRNNK